MNVLIQTSFVGDSILSLPTIYRLMELSSDNLVIVAAPRNLDLFQLALSRGLSPFSNRIQIVSWDKRGEHRGFFSFFELRRKILEKFPGEMIENVFCLQRSFRSGFLAWILRAKRVIGFSSGAASFFYSDNVPRSWDQGEHELNKNLSLLRAVFAEADLTWSSKTALSILASSQIKVRGGGPIVSLSLGSPWPTKRWDMTQALELCRDLLKKGVTLRLLGDGTTAELYSVIKEQLASPLLEDYSGKTTVSEWVKLIEESDVLLSGDSAAVHVASDLNRPVIALFGPTVPELGFAPWRRSGAHALGLEMACRPCDIHGPRNCPLGHHNCMKKLSSEIVLKRVESCLDGVSQKDYSIQ
ncbi:glycosyltransferase family 9 protein [bacterium]|nr:glycosyltransferase family 9 protein [bacterium]